MALTNPSREKFEAVCGKGKYKIRNYLILSSALPNGDPKKFGDYAHGLFGQVIYSGKQAIPELPVKVEPGYSKNGNLYILRLTNATTSTITLQIKIYSQHRKGGFTSQIELLPNVPKEFGTEENQKLYLHDDIFLGHPEYDKVHVYLGDAGNVVD